MSKIKEAFAKMEKHLFRLSPAVIRIWKQQKKLYEAMAEAGADLIELGIPFSDPTAEGPVIQEGKSACFIRRCDHG